MPPPQQQVQTEGSAGACLQGPGTGTRIKVVWAEGGKDGSRLLSGEKAEGR